VNLTRFHGVFGANSKHRSRIINQPSNNKTLGEVVATQSEKRIRMTWAQRLKRAFNIDITTCVACGGAAVKVIAYIDDPVIINKILTHLQSHQRKQVILPTSRAPPVYN
jgi:hypothetical protein